MIRSTKDMEQLAIILERCAHELLLARKGNREALADLQLDAMEDLALVREMLDERRSEVETAMMGAEDPEALATHLRRLAEELLQTAGEMRDNAQPS